jgi:hypothetical protein
MEKSSQIAWRIVPLKDFFPPKVVPLIEVLLYTVYTVYKRLCPNGYLERQKPTAEARGRIRGR